MTASLVKHLIPLGCDVTPQAFCSARLAFLAGCHRWCEWCVSGPPKAGPVSLRGSLSTTTHWPLSTFQLNLKLACTEKMT